MAMEGSPAFGDASLKLFSSAQSLVMPDSNFKSSNPERKKYRHCKPTPPARKARPKNRRELSGALSMLPFVDHPASPSPPKRTSPEGDTASNRRKKIFKIYLVNTKTTTTTGATHPPSTVPISSSSDSDLPTVCPAPYCTDAIATDPSTEIMSLFAKKRLFSPKNGKNTPGAGDLTSQIYRAIKLDQRRSESQRQAKINPREALEHTILELVTDSDALAECPIWEIFFETISYKNGISAVAILFSPILVSFGSYGKAIIYSNVERYLEEAIHPDQIYQTIANLHGKPEQWDNPDDHFTLLSAHAFIDYILSPFIAASLISEDFEIDLDSAMENMHDSSEFGDFFHSETSPVASKPRSKPALSTPMKISTKQALSKVSASPVVKKKISHVRILVRFLHPKRPSGCKILSTCTRIRRDIQQLKVESAWGWVKVKYGGVNVEFLRFILQLRAVFV
ncbi:hypothetical protein B0H13DRAFT_1858893 [Mycena leptocephala]|nr:hypothetical protein B0H13DRAFT_1858893 [Mycena leptocephala]